MFQLISILGERCEEKRKLVEELKVMLGERGYNVFRLRKTDGQNKFLIQFNELALEDGAEINQFDFLSQIAVRYSVDVFLTDEEVGPALRIISAASRNDLKLLEKVKPICIVTNMEGEYSIPCFKFNEVESLIEFIDGKYLRKILGVKVDLEVNGKFIPVNPFVGEIIRNIAVALVSSLKGVGQPKKILISIRE